jgi:2-iminobutanoate/2-iminopropanoate deaminase
MHQQVTTTPDPYEPYLLSQAVKLDNLVFVSGQAGYDADGKIVEGGFRPQGEQAFSNLRRALEAGGSSLEHVVKVTIFVTDMQSNFGAVVALRRKFWSKPYPADTIVQINALYHPDALIEIEAIAAIPTE